jgi:hypothetical protein
MNSSNSLATIGYYHLWTASDENLGDPLSFSEATRLLRLMTPGEMVHVQGLWVSPHTHRAMSFFVEIIDERAYMIPTAYVHEHMRFIMSRFSPAQIVQNRELMTAFAPDSARWRDAFCMINRVPHGTLTTSNQEEES